jgi:hypothetical protein
MKGCLYVCMAFFPPLWPLLIIMILLDKKKAPVVKKQFFVYSWLDKKNKEADERRAIAKAKRIEEKLEKKRMKNPIYRAQKIRKELGFDK